MAQIATYTKGHGVFVAVEQGAMLCIGEVDDIKEASPEEIVEIIYQARCISAYMMIGSGVNRVIH